MKSTLKHPDVRANLLWFLDSLRDRDYQEKCWIGRECPSGVVYDSFDMAVSFLFDDNDFNSAPEKQIGYSLYSVREADLIYRLCKQIDAILLEHGVGHADLYYIQLPEWKNVLDLASKCYQHLLSQIDSR